MKSAFTFALLVCAVVVAPFPVCARTPVATQDQNARDRLLRELPENHAVILGSPLVEGEFNATARRFQLHRRGPSPRDFSIKMVWAPDRKRALFLGANHGSPHRLNDVWEFDLEALTWHLLYAPDNSRSYGGLGEDPSDVEFKDGILVTRRGGPAIIGHTWWGIAYDPVRALLLFMNPWEADEDRIVRQLDGDPALRYKGPALWTFDATKRQWGFDKTPRPWPRTPYASALEYVPSLQGFLWHSNHWMQQSTWLYKPLDAQWKNLNPNAESGDFRRQAPAQEQVAYVDPIRDLMVAHSKRSTHHFDLKSAQWKRVFRAPDDSDLYPTGHDARTVFYYDPVSGHGLLCELGSARLWAYDPDSFTWRKLEPQGDGLPKKGGGRLAYLDVARNVFVIVQRDAVWAYRYRASAAGDRGRGK